MTISDNGLYSVAVQKPSPNRSGLIEPKFIVMHYTAGWSAASAINTLTNPKSKVSAHVTVDYDGTVYQHVPFNVKAWHAGPSQHMGYTNLNACSVGIEIVNPGYLRAAKGGFTDSSGNFHSEEKVGRVIEAKHARVGGGTFYWPVYPQEQLDAVEALSVELIDTYSIIDVTSHEAIDTRGWKTDPGPAFPLNRFRNLVAHRNSEGDKYTTTATSLNVRNGPGIGFGVISNLREGQVVVDLGRQGDWMRIAQDGWVNVGYLRRV